MYDIYDYEQAPNLHLGVFLNIENERIEIFEISERRNDLKVYQEYLRKRKGFVGFNNVGYDSWLMDVILKMPLDASHKYINDKLYEISKNAIRFLGRNYNPLKAQRDVFLIHHFDNKNKAVSLKQYQAFIGWDNVMDINFDPNKPVRLDQIDSIIFYCKNDVFSTYDLYKNTQVQLQLRRIFSREYGFDMMNFNDTKIGEQVILHDYCKITGKDKEKVANLRTFRNHVDLKDCIQSSIQFDSKEFTKVYNTFHAHRKYMNSDKKFEFSQVFKNISLGYGLGGIHGANTGSYSSDDKYCLLDIDIGSQYPSIFIEYGLYPAHLGIEFKGVARDIKNKRMKSKGLRKDKSLTPEQREYHNVMSDGLKLALNGGLYGKTLDKHSFMYDPSCTYSTSVSGQLFISMLLERLSVIPNIFFVQANTDGITNYVERKYLSQIHQICKKWEKDTLLDLEYAEFKELHLRDVSSFITEYQEVGDDYFEELKPQGNQYYMKAKGAYEVDKKVGAQWAYHKNNSSRIIPLAVKKYFFDSIPVESTIKNHTEIKDFLIWVKLKKDAEGNRWWINASKFVGNELKSIDFKDKIVRYYMSKDGYVLKKRNTENREAFLHVHPTHKKFNRFYKQTIANKIPEKFPDDIDYSYYIHEAKKLINAIEPISKQIKLEL